MLRRYPRSISIFPTFQNLTRKGINNNNNNNKFSATAFSSTFLFSCSSDYYSLCSFRFCSSSSSSLATKTNESFLDHDQIEILEEKQEQKIETNEKITTKSIETAATTRTKLTLLQQYTAPGVVRKHPLSLLTTIASNILQEQQEQQEINKNKNKNLWSVEELQLITAEAAKKIQKSSLRFVDDDSDEVATNTNDHLRNQSQEEELFLERKRQASGGLKNISSSSSSSNGVAASSSSLLIDSVVGEETNSNLSAFVEEQKVFDEFHETLFGNSETTNENLISRWILNWKLKNQNLLLLPKDSSSQQQQQQLLVEQNKEKKNKKKAEDEIANLSFLHALGENDDEVDVDVVNVKEEKAAEEQEEPSSFSVENNNNNNNNKISLSSSSIPTTSISEKQQQQNIIKDDSLACVVTLLQRHILLASLANRLDAAVEAFMALISIRDDLPTNIILDENVKQKQKQNKNENFSSSDFLEIPVISWRQLRDVISSAAATTSSNNSNNNTNTTNISIGLSSNYETAETLLRLVMRKSLVKNSGSWCEINDQNYGSSSSSSLIENLVTPQVLTALCKCIQNAADLQRFRELMAVECASSSSTQQQQQDNELVSSSSSTSSGALSHIPVSVELYTQLISACSRCPDEQQRQQYALMFLRAITDNGLVPTPRTYAAMVATYSADGACTEAFSMFHEAKAKCSPQAVALCPPLYNHLIESYCNAGKLYDAISTTNVLMDVAAPLTRRGFHAVMMCCAVQGDLSQCRVFLMKMQNLYSSSLNQDDDENPQNSYNISPTPTSLAITLSSLCFIRTEFDWKEKMTIIGDLTSEAFSVAPGVKLFLEQQQQQQKQGEKKDEEKEKENNSSDQFRAVSIFVEEEKFFCAILNRLLSLDVRCPSLSCDNYDKSNINVVSESETTTSSSSSSSEQKHKNEISTHVEENSSSNQKIKEKEKRTPEHLLYRRHVNLALRIVQQHTQQTLSLLLERAVNCRLKKFMEMNNNNNNINSSSFSSRQKSKQQHRKQQIDLEFAEALLEKNNSNSEEYSSNLFTPQKPMRIFSSSSQEKEEQNTEIDVAALMPDVILNPFGLIGDSEIGDESSPFSSNFMMKNKNSNKNAEDENENADNDEEENYSYSYVEEVGNSLIHLLATILPQTTLFILPFSSLSAIVMEADSLLTMNNHPLYQRELFGTKASFSSNDFTLNPEDRNLEDRIRNSNNNNKNGQKTTNIERILRLENQLESEKLMMSSGKKSNSFKNNNNDFENSSSSSSSTSIPLSLTDVGTFTEQERERRLDRLADVVFALAVFLNYHGDRVHIESAKDHLDHSRAAFALGLSNSFVNKNKFQHHCHRAAASCCAHVFSPLDLSRKDDLSQVANISRDHVNFCLKRRNNNNNKRKMFIHNNNMLSPVLNSLLVKKEKESSSSSSSKNNKDNDDENTKRIYFDAGVNLNLISCDATLKKSVSSFKQKQQQMFAKTNQNKNTSSSSSFYEVVGNIQKLSRDYFSYSYSHQQQQQQKGNGNGTSSLPSSSSSYDFRNVVVGSSKKSKTLSSLLSINYKTMKEEKKMIREQEEKNSNKNNNSNNHDRKRKKIFAVRFVDPTKVLLK